MHSGSGVETFVLEDAGQQVLTFEQRGEVMQGGGEEIEKPWKVTGKRGSIEIRTEHAKLPLRWKDLAFISRPPSPPV
jgi:hypothetical protein